MEPCSPASPDPDALCGSTLPSSDALIHRCATKRGKLRFRVVYVCMAAYGFYLTHMNGDNPDACFHSHEVPHTVGGYSREGLLTVVQLNSSIPVNATELAHLCGTSKWLRWGSLHFLHLSLALFVVVYVTVGRAVWSRMAAHGWFDAGMPRPSAAH